MTARRYFTVEEANALLPDLRMVLIAFRAGRRQITEDRAELAGLGELPKLNGQTARASELAERIANEVHAIREGLEGLTALGVEVKDLDSGLVDFPHWREGRVVYLCWRLGEERIAFWHDLDAGFRGRQPL
ncbi:MAG: DUF2203 domain-containing protein [Chloroflexota bacterium]|nr:DUF2203 domain-containing protein [Chloroflexota bacterium]